MLIALLVTGCRKAPPELKIDASTYARLVDFKKYENDEPIPVDFSISIDDAFQALLEISPANPMPEQYFERRVQAFEDWPMNITFTQTDKSKDVRIPCMRIYRKSDKMGMITPPLGKPLPSWKKFGNKIPAKVSFDWPEQNSLRATIIGPPFEEPGTYDYEISLFPLAHQISALRFERGQPLILRQGKITVLPVK